MITLRFASPEDAPALLEIYRPYVEHTTISFETELPTVKVFEERIRSFSRAFPYLVAQTEDEILGYAYAHPFHERAAYNWAVESSIYVKEAARGNHVGQQLYQALLGLLEAQGVQNVCAVVTIPNEPSLAFHRHMGFHTGGILPNFGYKHNRWHSVAYLYRSLGTMADDPKPVVSVHQLPPAHIQSLLRQQK